MTAPIAEFSAKRAFETLSLSNILTQHYRRRVDVVCEGSVYNAALMSAQVDVIEAREEAARAGEQIYEQNLRSRLEAFQTGRFVLIHLPSQDYFVGDSLLEASDRLREEYPNVSRGEVYARRVGQGPVIQFRTPRVTGEPT